MVIIINGYPQVGKDTFCNLIQEIIGKDLCNIYSSIDPIKKIALIGGWNGKKDLKSRKFLSDLKDLFTDFNDMPFLSLIKTVNEKIQYYSHKQISKNNYIIFIHVREPKEIKKITEALGAITLFIDKDIKNTIFSNHADEDVKNYKYDYIIKNNGTLEELKLKAFDFLKKIEVKY